MPRKGQFKSHCAHGHEMITGNFYAYSRKTFSSNGTSYTCVTRMCKACVKRRNKAVWDSQAPEHKEE